MELIQTSTYGSPLFAATIKNFILKANPFDLDEPINFDFYVNLSLIAKFYVIINSPKT